MAINPANLYIYTLKNHSVLPTDTKYVDPYAGVPFTPKPKETFDEFYTRIETYRASIPVDAHKNVQEAHLKEFIILSLAENLRPRTEQNLKKYFNIQAGSSIPSMSQSLLALKALVQEAATSAVTPIEKRRERAAKCLKCPFHTTNPRYSPALTSIFESAVNAVDKAKQFLTPSQALSSYPEEKDLKMCGICGCPLRSKIKFNINTVIPTIMPEDLLKGFKGFNPAHSYFGNCWMLNEALQIPTAKRALLGKIDNIRTIPKMPPAQVLLDLYLKSVLTTKQS